CRLSFGSPDALRFEADGMFEMLDLREQERPRRAAGIERRLRRLGQLDHGHENSGVSVRIVSSVSKSRNVGATTSRGDRCALSNVGSSHLMAVAGIDACSNTRASLTTVPL